MDGSATVCVTSCANFGPAEPQKKLQAPGDTVRNSDCRWVVLSELNRDLVVEWKDVKEHRLVPPHQRRQLGDKVFQAECFVVYCHRQERANFVSDFINDSER